jgi:hypothetical protein
MLRGHIRDSFADKQLYNLLKELSLNNDIKIYIHTWSIIQSSVSWRKMDKIEINVNENLIKSYFKDLFIYIKDILIESDEHITHEGTTNGYISLTQCPKIGWKNMWHGKKKIIDTIGNDIINIDEPIVNIRFDIFTNSISLKHDFVLNFIQNNKNKKSNKIILMNDREVCGIDNLYIGDFNTMFNFIYNFYYNLDAILQRHSVRNQEFIVFRENLLMNI